MLVLDLIDNNVIVDNVLKKLFIVASIKHK